MRNDAKHIKSLLIWFLAMCITDVIVALTFQSPGKTATLSMTV